MPPAPLHPDETARLQALRDLEILDTPPEPAFDLFPDVACQVFGTPVAAVSLVDRDRQWFKASRGLSPIAETPRDRAFCAYTILQPDGALVVPDATRDPRFADNPLVTGSFGLRFYAGVAISDDRGLPLGSLCILDRVPREIPPEKLDELRKLAGGVGTALRMQRSLILLRDLALRDPLTGAANRRAFDRRLEALLAQPTPRGALFWLDLDRFKTINDVFGHKRGDEVLRVTADRLRAALRTEDLVARLGGDEFAVICPSIRTPEAARGLAARLHATLADPLSFDGQAIPLRTSIGVALIPTAGRQPGPLLAAADAALYAAKRAGRGTTSVAGAEAPSLAGRATREQELREALLPPGREPFRLLFQPVREAATGRVVACEALVRWPQPDGTMLAPGEFIPVAEATGLILNLDRWVLRAACDVARTWPGDVALSVNLSASNFFDATLADQVSAALAEARFPPHRLTLEITESAILPEPERALAIMEALRAAGIRVALDDFGAGRASLADIRRFPFDEVKLDRAFIRGISAAEERSVALVRAMVSLAEAMGMATVAEGIETRAEHETLRSLGVTALQGYWLGHPVPAEALPALFAAAPANA